LNINNIDSQDIHQATSKRCYCNAFHSKSKTKKTSPGKQLLAARNALFNQFGWIPATNNRHERINNLREFFGVASLKIVPKTVNAMFRKHKQIKEISDIGVMTWLMLLKCRLFKYPCYEVYQIRNRSLCCVPNNF
jgi:hypothetical protein